MVGPAQMTCAQLADQIRQGNAMAFADLADSDWARLVRLRDEDERTLLHTAAATGQQEIVSAFLLHGGKAKVNTADENGWTPLMSACSSGHSDIVQALLSAGAQPGAINNTKRTALHYAASKGHTRALQLLLEAGADAGAKDELGATALHRACSALQEPAAPMLLDAKPSLVNMQDVEGNTPLHVIVSVGEDPRSIQIARILVKRGADVDVKNKAGEGALDLFGGKLPASIASVLDSEDMQE